MSGKVKALVEGRFKCKTPQVSEVKPDKVSPKVYGHHASYCEAGFRIWSFVSDQGRDKFVLDFDAEVIPDPVKTKKA